MYKAVDLLGDYALPTLYDTVEEAWKALEIFEMNQACEDEFWFENYIIIEV